MRRKDRATKKAAGQLLADVTTTTTSIDSKELLTNNKAFLNLRTKGEIRARAIEHIWWQQRPFCALPGEESL